MDSYSEKSFEPASDSSVVISEKHASLSSSIRRRSTRIKTPNEKPWLTSKQSRQERIANWLPIIGLVVGLLLTIYYIYSGYASVPRNKYCLILEDNFQTFDTSIWSHEITLGGNGNGEFQYYTDDAENSYVKNGELHISPTINNVDQVNGQSLNITSLGCTATDPKDCYAAVNSTIDTIINPVKSARLTTRFSKSIKYGRVEVRAKLPTGDWLWPAIWMMPTDSAYGAWPASGEIDLMESRGNKARTIKGGTDTVSSTLHWGPDKASNQYGRTHAQVKLPRGDYAEAFHTYGIEWSEDYIYTYIDSRLAQVLYRPTTSSFWKAGGFENTNRINPWVSGGVNAPFDRSFYLILNVAVGGTNGFFDDKLTKPWQNTQNDTAAMSSFWSGRQQWEPTWSNNTATRSMVVDSVKMWQQCNPTK